MLLVLQNLGASLLSSHFCSYPATKSQHKPCRHPKIGNLHEFFAKNICRLTHTDQRQVCYIAGERMVIHITDRLCEWVASLNPENGFRTSANPQFAISVRSAFKRLASPPTLTRVTLASLLQFHHDFEPALFIFFRDVGRIHWNGACGCGMVAREWKGGRTLVISSDFCDKCSNR